MQNLRALTEQVEQHTDLPSGVNERFSGYGVMSLPFSFGHVLALRRFPVTSVGPGYTSVWLRRPGGGWTIYTTVKPEQSCPRYFGNGIESTSIHDISLTWIDDRTFVVQIGDDVDLTWKVRLTATARTRFMNGVMSLIPNAGWRSAPFLRGMGVVSGPALSAGRIALTGTTPNRQRFRASPKRIWFVAESSARVGGVDFGVTRRLSVQDRLGDFWMPQRGIFMIGSATFDAVDR
jgi:hypothetical protein